MQLRPPRSEQQVEAGDVIVSVMKVQYVESTCMSIYEYLSLIG